MGVGDASMKVARHFTFSEDEVRAWCQQANDHNPLHLDQQAAEDHPIFEERIVPGMMMLDKVSGLLTQWGETKDGDVILRNIKNVTFHEAVPLDHEVTITLDEARDVGDEYLLHFFIEDEEQGYASGAARVKVA